jgi:hypothetical protein
MDESFYAKINGLIYEIILEEGQTYTVFKEGEEYIQILRNRNKKWMRIDYKTDLPIIEINDEVEDLGKAVEMWLAKQQLKP